MLALGNRQKQDGINKVQLYWGVRVIIRQKIHFGSEFCLFCRPIVVTSSHSMQSHESRTLQRFNTSSVAFNAATHCEGQCSSIVDNQASVKTSPCFRVTTFCVTTSHRSRIQTDLMRAARVLAGHSKGAAFLVTFMFMGNG